MENEELHNMDPVALLPRVIAGEALPEEISRVEVWASDPANRKEYDDIVRLWEMTGSAVPSDEINVEREWNRMESAIFHKHRQFPLMRYLQVAAVVLIVSALAFIAIKQGNTRFIHSPSAQSSHVLLPDGSGVFLNAGSRISYRKGFGTANRQIILKGEAYFEVIKNPDIPFVVSAGNARVEVTGTRFNVKAYRHTGRIRVTVTEGTVLLSEAGSLSYQTPVHAGETGWYNTETRKVTRSDGQNPNDLSWKTRILDFHDTPLEEVTELLTNTYHRSFEMDPALRSCTVTVRFDNRSLEDVLSVLQSTLGLEIREKGNHFIITGPGC